MQLAVVEVKVDSERYPDMKPMGLRVFVNPRVTAIDETPQGFWEGCLSVPGLRGYVERPRKVRVDYLDLSGKEAKILPSWSLVSDEEKKAGWAPGGSVYSSTTTSLILTVTLFP